MLRYHTSFNELKIFGFSVKLLARLIHINRISINERRFFNFKDIMNIRQYHIIGKSITTIDKNQVFTLENVYYEFNKWDITDSAAVELDKLVVILKDNPAIEIELGSHTDSRGNKDYNKTLSEKRAQSAVDYIVRNGIDTKRIVAKGYGFDNPLIVNAVTEEDHQKNRRTEFKVTKINQQ